MVSLVCANMWDMSLQGDLSTRSDHPTPGPDSVGPSLVVKVVLDRREFDASQKRLKTALDEIR